MRKEIRKKNHKHVCIYVRDAGYGELIIHMIFHSKLLRDEGAYGTMKSKLVEEFEREIFFWNPHRSYGRIVVSYSIMHFFDLEDCLISILAALDFVDVLRESLVAVSNTSVTPWPVFAEHSM